MLCMMLRNDSYSKRAPIVHIDMTPLVDLGFLLLIFFMFLLTLQTPKTIEIRMPEYGGCGPRGITLHTTLIISPQNKVCVYKGPSLYEEKVNYQVFDNEPKQLEKYLLQLAKQAGKIKNRYREPVSALSVWIKPEDTASYEDVIEVLDMVRNLSIRQYGLIDTTQSDIDFLKGL